MVTGYDHAVDLVRVRLNTSWTALHPTYPIAWENLNFTPTKDSSGKIIPWIRPVITFVDALQTAIAPTNQNRYRQPGIYSVSVFTAVGIGEGLGYELAEEVASIFRGLNESGVQFRAPVIRRIGVRDDIFQLNVDTEFYFDMYA